jgi:Skp family chaperone for outer membrane proteins
MLDISDNQQTHINFNTIFQRMKKILDSKQKLEDMFEKFTDQINSLNSYIDLYEEQLKSSTIKRSDNDSNRCSNLSKKKKLCSNFNDNDDDDDDDDNNNNNNISKSKKPYKICPYRETDPQGKKE